MISYLYICGDINQNDMSLADYMAPLAELQELASRFDAELFEFMQKDRLCTWLKASADVREKVLSMDNAAYESRVRELWDDYKRIRFHPVTERDLAVLEGHLEGLESVPFGDIFLYLSSENKEIQAFQKAMKVEALPILLVTNADTMENVMGLNSARLSIDEWDDVLFCRDLSFGVTDFFEGWRNMSLRSDLYAPELIFQGGATGARLNFMHIIRPGCRSCHIEVPASGFSCEIPSCQLPNFDPVFYMRLAELTGSMPTLWQSMECVYNVSPSSCMAEYRGRSMRYYDPARERLVDIHIPADVGGEYCIQAVNAEVSRHMVVLDHPCYILDGNSIVGHYGCEPDCDGKAMPLCLDESYDEDDVCVLVPYDDENIIGDPRFMGEINRLAKGVRLGMRELKGRLSTKEMAFCFSCIHLNDAEALKTRISECLRRHHKDAGDDELRLIVSDIIAIRREEPRYFNDEYMMYEKDASGNYGLLCSPRGKRRAGDPMSRQQFLKVYWGRAAGWGISKSIVSEKHIIDWQFFGDLFGVPKSQRDCWRRIFSDMLNRIGDIN